MGIRRDAMLVSIEEELVSIEEELMFLDEMRKESIENITFAEGQVTEAKDKLRQTIELQSRFEQRTEMCESLKTVVQEFGAGLEALQADRDTLKAL